MEKFFDEPYSELCIQTLLDSSIYFTEQYCR
jgi:hypothetical protein